MLESLIVPFLNKYGFEAALSVFVLSLSTCLVKWILKQQERLSERADKREDMLMNIIGNYNKGLEGYNENQKNITTEIKTAHAFQRKEHEALSKEHEDIKREQDNFRDLLERRTGNA